jgi:hypothetical protein
MIFFACSYIGRREEEKGRDSGIIPHQQQRARLPAPAQPFSYVIIAFFILLFACSDDKERYPWRGNSSGSSSTSINSPIKSDDSYTHIQSLFNHMSVIQQATFGEARSWLTLCGQCDRSVTPAGASSMHADRRKGGIVT